jgi:outer membrane protein TolC
MRNVRVTLLNFFIPILVLIFSSTVLGQLKKYSLDDAIQTALTNNRDIKVALMEIQKAEAAVDEAFGYALPSLDVNASFTHFLEKPKMSFPDFESLLSNATYSILFDEGVLPRDDDKFKPVQSVLQSFAQTNSFETSAQITQILFNSAVFRGIGASQIYLNLSQEQLKGKIASTIVDVKKAFYGALLTKELHKIMSESFTNAEENLANVNALHKQGLVSEFDAIQVKVQVENLRPKVIELENAFKNAKNGLKIVLGIEQSIEIEIEGEISYTSEFLPDEMETISKSLEYNYDLNSLKIKRDVDEAFIDLERAEYWPTIAAYGNYSFAGSSDNWDFQTYRSAVVGLNFSINLFKGGQSKNRVEQSTISAMQTGEQIDVLKDVITSQVKNKLQELNKVSAQISAIEENINLAERAYEIAKTRYKEGTGTQLEIKNADLELRSAKTNKLKAFHDYIIAKAELNQLTGTLPEKYISLVKNNFSGN